jgi:hypothetical protein
MVNGQEVSTLTGHMDLRRPLELDESWIAGVEEKN